MAETSHIEWTDATWNPVTGCSVVSPGCKNCYAMKLAGTRLRDHPSRVGLTQWTKSGPVWTGEVRLNEQWLSQPLSWRRPRRIFVCAHGDLFHEDVPDEWIDRVFAVMALAPRHTFQVLTKRAARMRAYLSTHRWHLWGAIGRALDAARWASLPPVMGGDHTPLPNVWLGVSVEDQQRADDRIPYLLATPAAVRFLSCEPLLGPVDLTWLDLAAVEAREREPSGLTRLDALTGIHSDDENGDIPGIWGEPDPRVDWVICGGESGAAARPMHPDWARSLRDQCAAAGVPFFFKQWGAWAPDPSANCIEASTAYWPDGTIGAGSAEMNGGLGTSFWQVGKKAAGRLLDGVAHDGMPLASNLNPFQTTGATA